MTELVETERQDYEVSRAFTLTPQQVMEQVNLVREITKIAMKEGIHYGRHPGTKSHCLKKPGADLLCVMFRCSPEYEVVSATRNDAFLAYTVRCTLRHQVTEKIIAQGQGSCNSREKKYGYAAKNIWDVDNTILKMAQKRAKVDAAINATGCSELFTQDVEEEDMPRHMEEPPMPEHTAKRGDAGELLSGARKKK